jgi:hypothetical protein
MVPENQAKNDDDQYQDIPEKPTSNDFEQLKAKNMTAPRMFFNTGIIEPTLMNSKRIKIRVINGEHKAGGFFAASFV